MNSVAALEIFFDPALRKLPKIYTNNDFNDKRLTELEKKKPNSKTVQPPLDLQRKIS